MERGFVGRDRELAELAGSRGGVVLIGGEAGIGKSTLVERYVSGLDGPVLAGRAVPDAGMPGLWPWRRALEQAAALGLPGLGPELLEVEGDSPFDPAAAVRFRAFERVVRALREVPGLTVVLEDLHWADQASLALLGLLAGETEGPRPHVIGTYRDDEAGVMTGLLAQSRVRRLGLGPLTVAEVAEYLRGRAGGQWPAAVHRRSGGNPLYVRELASLLARENVLAGPPGELPVPPGLRAVVARRLDGLGRDCRALLARCAVIGEEADLRLLPGADGLEEALAAGILGEDPGRPLTVRFSHEVVRQVCYELVGRADRVAHHRDVAEALTLRGADDALVARHRLASAADEPSRALAVAACRRAAEAELARAAFAGAARWYAEAFRLADDDAERAALLLGEAESAGRDGQVTRAAELCGRALTLAERLGDGPLATRAALVVKGVGGPETATLLAALCERAFAVLGHRDDARLLAQHATALAEAGNVEAAAPVSARALELAEDSGDPETLIDALNSRRVILSGVEGIAALLSDGARLRSAARRAGRLDAELWSHVWRIDAALQLGSVTEADHEITALTAVVERLGRPLARWHLYRIQASRALLEGRFAECRRLTEAAYEVARQTQDSSAQNLYFATMTNLFVLLGDDGSLAAPFHAMEEGARPPLMLASRAAFHARLGDLDRAAVLYERFRPHFDELVPEPRWSATMMWAADAAALLGDHDTVAVCYRRLLPWEPYHQNLSAGILGPIARVLGRTAPDPETADAHFTVAEAKERKAGGLPWLAVAQAEHAQLLAGRGGPGDRDRAERLAEAALHTSRRLGMRPTERLAARLLDELSGVTGGPSSLTPQERLVAGRIAQGRTNREIAGALVLSERTIETHVRNALRKLGLANRTQLAAWSLRAGLGADLSTSTEDR